MGTWIKICGMTSFGDAHVAYEAGANAIGFILTPSPRQIEPTGAAAIRAELPEELETVGVFTNESAEDILETAHFIGLSRIQLHGAPRPELIDRLWREYPLIQAIPVETDGRFTNAHLELPVQNILLDTSVGGHSGGTGQTFDWSILKQLDSSRLIVAGGVSATNVHELVVGYRPFGVDANSKLELAPGVKDHEKIKAFVAAVRSADQEGS
jgi:phosphoribosylanthranilate isomerase